MTSNVILFGWNRPLPGRENLSAAHFGDFVNYLEGLKASGAIESYEVVFLDSHGGDLNGFFLIRAAPAKLDAMMSSTDWLTHMTRAAFHLDGSGAVRGSTGDNTLQRMTLWTGLIPS